METENSLTAQRLEQTCSFMLISDSICVFLSSRLRPGPCLTVADHVPGTGQDCPWPPNSEDPERLVMAVTVELVFASAWLSVAIPSTRPWRYEQRNGMGTEPQPRASCVRNRTCGAPVKKHARSQLRKSTHRLVLSRLVRGESEVFRVLES
uniref:uncharacterized protein LOC118531892 n=1 Tax=Halichoerus grypus TaxID=9711 RepID=UPI0016597D0B|nr:uncharacterized protein LOC118531892 [Halichoerus grypus]